ncbi:hypothetical protein [Pararhodobacter marinus]|nr:hypothetical protein [Pararhodobacter marinus]
MTLEIEGEAKTFHPGDPEYEAVFATRVYEIDPEEPAFDDNSGAK